MRTVTWTHPPLVRMRDFLRGFNHFHQPWEALARRGEPATADLEDELASFIPPEAASPTVGASLRQARQASGRSLDIPRDARGHFQTDGRIDGQRVNFMIDTGASLVALNEKSAAQFGLRPSRSDYNATVTTANGTIKAARTRLAMIELGGLVVRDVDAVVLPDEALSENLLGLSFLSKLKRFEYANGRLVLEQ